MEVLVPEAEEEAGADEAATEAEEDTGVGAELELETELGADDGVVGLTQTLKPA